MPRQTCFGARKPVLKEHNAFSRRFSLVNFALSKIDEECTKSREGDNSGTFSFFSALCCQQMCSSMLAANCMSLRGTSDVVIYP